MVAKNTEVSREEFEKMKNDLELLKKALFEEGELTEEAKREIEESRKTPLSECVSQEEVEKEFE